MTLYQTIAVREQHVYSLCRHDKLVVQCKYEVRALKLSIKPVFFGTMPIQLEIQTPLLLTRLLQISANEISSSLKNNSKPYGKLSPSQNLGLCGEVFELSTNNSKSFCTVELSQLCNNLPQSVLFCDRGKIDT